jgi:hypothetical protein
VSASIAQAAASGTHRDLLVAMRDRIAEELDAGVPARELASCTKRLMEVVREIAAIDAEEQGDVVSLAAATDDVPWAAAS